MVSMCTKTLLMLFAIPACVHRIAHAQYSDSGAIGNNGTTPCPDGLTLVPTLASGGTGFDNVASYKSQNQFCCQGSAYIAIWAQTDSSFSSSSSPLYSRYVGTISAACSDGTILPLVTDGSSFSNQCPLPSSISKPYSNYSSTGFRSFASRGGPPTASSSYSVLTSFSALQQSSPQASFSCPAGKIAVGYSVTSNCYGLTNLQIVCGSVGSTTSPAPTTQTPPPRSLSGAPPPILDSVPAIPPPLPLISGSSPVAYYPVFAPLPTGGIALAGTFRSSSTGQEVSLNGTFNAVIFASKTIVVPTVLRAGCSSLSLKGLAPGVNAFASATTVINAAGGLAGYLDPSTGGTSATAGGIHAINNSGVDNSTISTNFTVPGNVTTIALNNPTASNASVSVAATYQPRGACIAKGSSSTIVGIQKNNILNPGAAGAALVFTNATCIRLSVSVTPYSNDTASQTVMAVRVVEGPPVDAFTGFRTLSPVSINLTIVGSKTDLTQGDFIIRTNNTLDPQRLYRIDSVNSGQQSADQASTVSISAAFLSAPGADCSTISGGTLSVPAGTLSEATTSIAPAPVASPPAAEPGSQPVPPPPSAPAPNTVLLCRLANKC